MLVAGVVTIAIVLTTTSDGQKNNRSDSPGVAGAYAAAFAASPPLTVATYDSCAQLLAARWFRDGQTEPLPQLLALPWLLAPDMAGEAG